MTGQQRVAVAGAGLAVAGWFLHPLMVTVGVVVVVGVGVVWRQRRCGSAGLALRWSAQARRHHGLASRWQILTVASAWAMRRKATVLRPSLASLGWWARWRSPIRELATPLMRVGWWRIWSPVEDTTLTTGGPGTGKSAALACRIIDAPGMVVATSTATDLLDNTTPLRSRIGPVLVFNPAQVGTVPSTLTFNPLTGCEDPVTARYRAGDLLAGLPKPGHDGEFWVTQARMTLTVLLHAAALGDATPWDLHSWLSNPAATADTVLRLLARSPQPVPMSEAAVQFYELADRARGSVTSTVLQALEWLHDPRVVAVTQTSNLDVETLMAQRATVHLLGGEEAHTTPLVTAMTAHIAREARRIAALQPKGRLDPALTMVLDEATLVCPVPLPTWTADTRKRNITIHIALQCLAQMRDRWGSDGASTILTNAASVLVFGGARNTGDLTEYSTLVGRRHEDNNWVPVLSPALIDQLPNGRAVLIRRGMRPAIGRPPRAWKRWDVRSDRLAARCTALAQWASSRLPRHGTAVGEPKQPHLRVVKPDSSEAA